ncbi:MAG: type II secretion system protein [Verrucomicrobiota bacterium]
MKNTSEVTRRLSKKAGLTLIELLVVLVILIATGSLLVPTIKDALTRSHVATCASSFPEVHQMMQRVQLEFGAFGTDFDSGVDTADTTTPVNAAASAAPVIQTEALTADEVTALAAVGITSVVDHDATADDYNITFNIGATSRTLADGEPVITLTDAQAEAVFLPVGAGIKYVWFGIGRDWTLLVDLAPEPPVHNGDTEGVLPDEVHSRF